MISEEEVELALSFKCQLNEKIAYFNQKQIEIKNQEKELQILLIATEKAKEKFEKQAIEYRNTLKRLKEQIAFEREQLRAEESARNDYLLRSNRNSKSTACLPIILVCEEKIENA